MVLINKAINEITVKLVYYGPGLCGKTTNLEKIYGNPKLDNKGKMISMSTETDRTLFFDFMPMELGTIGGQKVRVQLYTVPGQVFYDATRKLVLRGADGVVFVADSQSSMRESNIESLENLKTNLRLNRIDPDKVAIVYQLNKRDLPSVASVEEMTSYLGALEKNPVVEAAAIQGVGVTATLRAAIGAILDNLKKNVDTTLYDQPELGAPDMSARSGVTHGSAGTPKLSMHGTMPTPPPAPPPPVVVPEPQPEPVAAAVAVEEDPFEQTADVTNPFASYGAVEVEEEEAVDPFESTVAVAEPEPEPVEDPFAHTAGIHDESADRAELEMLLTSTRRVIGSLEIAIDAARDSERTIMERLSRLP
jgi:signal recognition particle receptor subunit beta